MKKEYPMTVAQEAVLKRLGLLNEVRGYNSAKALLGEIGLEASYDRATREVSVTIVDSSAGGFNAYGEGETWTIDTRHVDLAPIAEWITNPERLPKPKAEVTPEPKPETEADNGWDFERDEELQAEIDADAALNDDEAEYQEEAAIAASKQGWGGKREGAGRPQDSSKAETREPLYQQGYQAGYKAAARKMQREPETYPTSEYGTICTICLEPADYRCEADRSWYCKEHYEKICTDA